MTDLSLNIKQQIAYDFVNTGKNILITGPAGTGKSYTLNNIVNYLNKNKKNYGITAMTGCAAVLIGGQTLHSFLGIGLANDSIENTIFKLKTRKNFLYNKLKKLDNLIIDEISMMDSNLFNFIYNYLKKIKENDLPFGGIQLILVGDFYQLPPINGLYCFESNLWNGSNINIIQLTELIRQNDDIVFQEILQEIRNKKCSKKIYNILKDLSNTTFENNIIPTKLFPLNKNVDEINNKEYNLLCKKNNNVVNKYIAFSTLKTFKTEPYNIELTIDAQIMITRNIDISSGIANGTRGIVIELKKNSVIIKDLYNNLHEIFYYQDKINTNDYINFMPIRLAYALSIHKSQGMTIDALEIDIGNKIFISGQLYTALSRAKSLKSIRIIDIHPDSFMNNCKVKNFYNNIE